MLAALRAFAPGASLWLYAHTGEGGEGVEQHLEAEPTGDGTGWTEVSMLRLPHDEER